MSPAKPKSPLPKIFIGSTKEALDVANLIQEKLFHEADSVVWTDPGVFEVGGFTIESLEKRLNDAPFGIFVMSPDDTVISRKTKSLAPRDNLIFELGLWVGRHGRHSAFMVVPFGEEIRLPSDLKGINTAEYKKDNSEPPVYDVSVACNKILRAITEVQKKKTTSRE
jgi:CRP/FNR family cyclic AMP-dependent transcriptional regulator